MKSRTITKLIHYVFIRDNKQGFRWWELLLVIVIGMLSSIAIPSFLSCGSIPASSRGKVYVRSMNNAQQAYFIESGKFSPTINQLGHGISEETTMYKYSTKITQNSAFNYGVAKQKYLDKNNFFDKKPVYSFVGAVFVINDSKINEKHTITILCKNDVPGNIKPNHPIFKNGIATCGEGTTDINKNTQR